MQVIKHLRGFHKKISANHYFLNARRKDLAKQVQVNGELPQNNVCLCGLSDASEQNPSSE